MKIIIDVPVELVEKRHWYTDEELWTVIKAAQNGIPLDKIRAEIQENINYNKKMNYQGIVAGLLLTLDIIDNET